MFDKARLVCVSIVRIEDRGQKKAEKEKINSDCSRKSKLRTVHKVLAEAMQQSRRMFLEGVITNPADASMKKNGIY